MDSDNASYPDVAPMHVILQDALDDLSSTRTSTAAKGEALVAIEHVLAQAADPRAAGLPNYFNALQDTFQCNIASRIVSWTIGSSASLDTYLAKDLPDGYDNCNITTLSAQLTLAMTLIQGVALVHKPSKQFLGRRYALEVLLDLLLVSRRLSHSSNGPSVPTSPKSGAFSAPVYKSQEIPLASVVLDTLLCILVDSIPALRVFEELNGVQVVVKILKRSGTPREVRMKCLEFIYFYLMDETTPPESVAETTSSIENLDGSAPLPQRTRDSLSAGFTTRPSSRSSSGSSTFSTLSTSTAATSASLHSSPSPTKGESKPQPQAPSDPTPLPRSVIPGLTPSSRAVTPPAGGPNALGRGQPRSLLILKKEVDYVPQSPKKPQLSHLGRGPSGLRPKAPSERSQPGTPASSLRVRRPRDPLSSSTSTDTDGGEPRKQSSTIVPSSAPRTPRPRTSLTSGHGRGLSVSSISSVSSTGSASTPSHSPSSSRTDLAPRAPTPARGAGLKAKDLLDTPKSAVPPSSSKLHRRTQSLADFAADSPRADLKGGPRSASSPTASSLVRTGVTGPRTMAEKKEILGTMLGNVDALVEGVKKAGVWGLS